ncbi:MAG: VCBS repeat-containing protein [Planctomycetota bacterium]|nr:VCBS repeat-containing protein [Planctomycetota bacterium]
MLKLDSIPARWLPLLMPLALAGTVLGQGFGDQVKLDPTGPSKSSVFAADVDGDGQLDLIAAEDWNGSVAWFRQVSLGQFGPRVQLAGGLGTPWRIVAQDMDGDQDVDIVVPTEGSSSVVWLENPGTAAAWTKHSLTIGLKGTGDLVVLDADEDGDPDILATSRLDHKLTYLENLGSGAFAAPVTVTTDISGAKTLGAADLDGDGHVDLLLGGYVSGSIATLKGAGDGSFGAPMEFAEVFQPGFLGGFDLDGDGDQDVLCTGYTPTALVWFENDGAGNLGLPKVIDQAFGATSAHAVDFDLDGDLDVCLVAFASNLCSWYENLGAGNFGPRMELGDGIDGPKHVHVADLDGNGAVDLAVAAKNDDSLSYFPNLAGLLPKLDTLVGLHCAVAGEVVLVGEDLLGATLAIDGVPTPVKASTDTTLTFDLPIDVPGGRHDLALSNGFGTKLWPGGLARYPVLELPPTVELGAPLDIVLDNGGEGLYVLGISGDLYATPAPFTGLGWYHGLELNGVWLSFGGAFTAMEPTKTLTIPPSASVGLVGITFHFQAWTHQSALGLSGFTAVQSVLVE